MDVALQVAATLALIYIPGALLFNAFIGRVFHSDSLPQIGPSFSLGAVIACIVSILLHAASLVTCDRFYLVVTDAGIALTTSLSDASHREAVTFLRDHALWLVGYLAVISVIAFLIGWGLNWVALQKLRLDRHIHIVRFKPEWYYLLKAQDAKGQRPEVSVDVLSEVSGVPVLYKGIVKDLWFNRNTGDPDTIILSKAERARFDATRPRCDAKFVPIKGERDFAVRFGDIKNINVQYYYTVLAEYSIFDLFRRFVCAIPFLVGSIVATVLFTISLASVYYFAPPATELVCQVPALAFEGAPFVGRLDDSPISNENLRARFRLRNDSRSVAERVHLRITINDVDRPMRAWKWDHSPTPSYIRNGEMFDLKPGNSITVDGTTHVPLFSRGNATVSIRASGIDTERQTRPELIYAGVYSVATNTFRQTDTPVRRLWKRIVDRSTNDLSSILKMGDSIERIALITTKHIYDRGRERFLSYLYDFFSAVSASTTSPPSPQTPPP